MATPEPVLSLLLREYLDLKTKYQAFRGQARESEKCHTRAHNNEVRLEKAVKEQEAEISKKDEKIKELALLAASKVEENEELKMEITKKDEKIEEQRGFACCQDKIQTIEVLKSTMDAKEKYIKTLESNIVELRAVADRYSAEDLKTDDVIKNLMNTLEDKESTIRSVVAKNVELSKTISKRNKTIGRLEEINRATNERWTTEINSWRGADRKKTEELIKCGKEIAELKNDNKAAGESVSKVLEGLANKISELEEKIIKKDDEIARFKHINSNFENYGAVKAIVLGPNSTKLVKYIPSNYKTEELPTSSYEPVA